ncbi:tetratricopeptide repeat protein [Falsirhodobacter sp. alg1]|uniref:tetratricopeptide repeat protein n=1 Tax=Falsirhodobacter sp. alg1 TaxID=1472418 RepID=UPI0005EDC910|nr:tetratricopeptide repeat protein [Falsirhodobacter sp. alg1]
MRDQMIFRPALLALALCLPSATMAQDAGAYLAAQNAASSSDHRAATYWLDRALQADSGNPDLLEGSVVANIASNNFPAAIAVAQTMGSSGLQSPAMYIALLDQQAKAKDWAAILDWKMDQQPIGALLENLVKSWALLGQGKPAAAMKRFDAIAATQGLESFGLYHKALALASVGDMEGAEAIFSDADHPLALTRRGVLAHIQILSQLDRNEDAIDLATEAFLPSDPTYKAVTAELRAGETLDWTVARNASDGVSEVFYTLASALQGEAGDTFTLLYARVATDLRPDQAEAQILVGELLDQQGQTELAIDAYDQVSPDDMLHEAAEVARADALFGNGQQDEALAVLATLIDERPDALGPQVGYADALRRMENYKDALPAYDRALRTIGRPSAQYWPVLFSRGIVHERLGQYTESEADMRAALELQPDQPDVLNYLGYALVEQGRKLDEALDMIQRAVEAEPDSGAIQDSLGWALFQLGRFDEAVEPMVQAVALEPSDPIITDHLADVYWAVGRRAEARFQWRRALSFDPTEAEAERIHKKLELGLEQVLTDEGKTDLATKITDAHDNTN